MSICSYISVNNGYLNFLNSNYLDSYKYFNNERSYEQAIIKTNGIKEV